MLVCEHISTLDMPSEKITTETLTRITQLHGSKLADKFNSPVLHFQTRCIRPAGVVNTAFTMSVEWKRTRHGGHNATSHKACFTVS